MSDLSGFRLRLLKTLDPGTARKLGEGIQSAQRFHSRWLGEFHKSIVCGTPFPDDVRSPDSHCRCEFGRWMAVVDSTPLADDAEIVEIRRLHVALHGAAAELVGHIEGGRPVAPVEYDRFLSTHEAFLSRLNGLIYEIIRTDLQFDPLTGTLGRPAMEEMVRREYLRAERTETPACVAMVDIDRLKDANDRFGHSFGDQLLGVAARVFAAGLRSYDLMFRYGGDEFLICLPNADLATAHQILERLRSCLAGERIPTHQGKEIAPTASFGVAELKGGPVGECVEHADQALYRAKQAGRNRVIDYEEECRVA